MKKSYNPNDFNSSFNWITNKYRTSVYFLASINCHFEYFSDDFYIFCNKYDNETIRGLFNQVLAENDHEGNDRKIEIEDYESYNIENLLTRYWKAIMRHKN
jgi:hypothetical protein